MRYVYLAVAIGLLVVGTISYTAQAAQAEAASGSRLINGLGLESFTRLARPVRGGNILHARAAYVALKEQEKRDRESVESFGEWGPYLVRSAEKYGQDPAELYRVMTCESKGDANADNGVCKGLFQFDPSTWAGTPFASASIFDGPAQIDAAAWMFSQGRKGEWTCQ